MSSKMSSVAPPPPPRLSEMVGGALGAMASVQASVQAAEAQRVAMGGKAHLKVEPAPAEQVKKLDEITREIP